MQQIPFSTGGQPWLPAIVYMEVRSEWAWKVPYRLLDCNTPGPKNQGLCSGKFNNLKITSSYPSRRQLPGLFLGSWWGLWTWDTTLGGPQAGCDHGEHSWLRIMNLGRSITLVHPMVDYRESIYQDPQIKACGGGKSPRNYQFLPFYNAISWAADGDSDPGTSHLEDLKPVVSIECTLG